jgi:hypothetical protein
MGKGKRKRDQNYREAVSKMNEHDVRLGVAMAMVKDRYYTIPPWDDPNSPTGMSQVCDYFGTCQSPCNGDC